MNSFLKGLLDNKVIEIVSLKGKESYVLTSNKSITLRNDVIQKIKAQYTATAEIGGVLRVRVINENQLVAVDVSFFDNTLNDPSKYSPNFQQYHKAVNEIVRGNDLPFFFHTHPTKLGISSYDSQRAYFYLTSSFADRDASFFPYKVDGLELVTPSLIFVSDARFQNGIGVSMYGGNIFPLSFARLRDSEILVLQGSIVIALLALIAKKRNVLALMLISVLAVLVYYIVNKPSYTHLSNGDIIIHS